MLCKTVGFHQTVEYCCLADGKTKGQNSAACKAGDAEWKMHLGTAHLKLITDGIHDRKRNAVGDGRTGQDACQDSRKYNNAAISCFKASAGDFTDKVCNCCNQGCLAQSSTYHEHTNDDYGVGVAKAGKCIGRSNTFKQNQQCH